MRREYNQSNLFGNDENGSIDFEFNPSELDRKRAFNQEFKSLDSFQIILSKNTVKFLSN